MYGIDITIHEASHSVELHMNNKSTDFDRVGRILVDGNILYYHMKFLFATLLFCLNGV